MFEKNETFFFIRRHLYLSCPFNVQYVINLQGVEVNRWSFFNEVKRTLGLKNFLWEIEQHFLNILLQINRLYFVSQDINFSQKKKSYIGKFQLLGKPWPPVVRVTFISYFKTKIHTYPSLCKYILYANTHICIYMIYHLIFCVVPSIKYA